ncbi:MAG: SpoIIE family protein phosphatase [Leptolyngbyaceae cyanobacterium CRU_2_3]|nr:SpoIIE family protein phosphatase [Leptolyngbyaceae cyanobacterium CRU_2_3]
MPVGMLPNSPYVSDCCEIPLGSTLYLFSDGIYEVMQSSEVFWSLDEFIATLAQLHQSQANLGQIIATVQSLSKMGTLRMIVPFYR